MQRYMNEDFKALVEKLLPLPEPGHRRSLLSRIVHRLRR